MGNLYKWEMKGNEKVRKFMLSCFKIVMGMRMNNGIRSRILKDNTDFIAAYLKLDDTDTIVGTSVTYHNTEGIRSIICKISVTVQNEAGETRDIDTIIDILNSEIPLDSFERDILDMLQFIHVAMQINKKPLKRKFYQELINYDKTKMESSHAVTTTRDHWTIGWKRRILQYGFDPNMVEIQFTLFGNANYSEDDIGAYRDKDYFNKTVTYGNMRTPEAIDFFGIILYYLWSMDTDIREKNMQKTPKHHPMENFEWLDDGTGMVAN